VIVKFPDLPLPICAEEGETDIVKSGVGGGVVTVNVTSTLWVKTPLTPVILTT